MSRKEKKGTASARYAQARGFNSVAGPLLASGGLFLVQLSAQAQAQIQFHQGDVSPPVISSLSFAETNPSRANIGDAVARSLDSPRMRETRRAFAIDEASPGANSAQVAQLGRSATLDVGAGSGAQAFPGTVRVAEMRKNSPSPTGAHIKDKSEVTSAETLAPKKDSVAALALQALWTMAGDKHGRLDISPSLADDRVRARSISVVDSMSVFDATKFGEEKSYLLGASRAKTQASVDGVHASFSGVLPSLDLRIARGKETSTPSSKLDDRTGEPLSTSSQTRVEGYAVLSQPLLDLAAVAEIRRAYAIRQASHADEAGVKGDVSYDVVAAFYGAVEASLLLQLTNAQQARLEKLWNWVSARAEAGGSSGAERERIRARVLAARSAVEDASSQLNMAAISLSRLTGGSAAALQLPTAADMPAIGTLEEALAEVGLSNAAVLTAQANQAAAKYERQAKLAKFSPVVRFELSSNKVKNSGGIPGWKEDRRAMFVMTMPLFSGGADYFGQRAALAKEQQHEFERLEAERVAEQSLQIAFSGLESARQKLESLSHQLTAQERVVAAFDAQLSSATRNLLDVFDAYQQLHQSRVDLTRTSIQAVLLQHQVLRVTGRLARDVGAVETAGER